MVVVAISFYIFRIGRINLGQSSGRVTFVKGIVRHYMFSWLIISENYIITSYNTSAENVTYQKTKNTNFKRPIGNITSTRITP